MDTQVYQVLTVLLIKQLQNRPWTVLPKLQRIDQGATLSTCTLCAISHDQTSGSRQNPRRSLHAHDQPPFLAGPWGSGAAVCKSAA